MGATYTRQSTFTDGDVITSDLFNNEYDQLLAAFAASSGHTHDGTAGEGGPITGLLADNITIGTNAGDITLNFNGGSNDGAFKWMEDEDYFEFSDDILIATTEKIQFRDTGIYINSSADGQLDLVADTEIQIAATTIDINGNVNISGTLTVGDAGISEAELEILDGATLSTAELNILDGVTSTTAELNILDGVTSTAAELNILDGVTSTATEINLLDGVTSTTAELNILDGVTSTAAELNILDGVTSTAAELNILDGVTSTTAELNILDGVTSTAAELNILDGVTSTADELNILDGKAFLDEDNFASNSATGIASQQSIKAYVDGVTVTNITSTGALNSGSITSGFGNIDNGSSTITTTGLISGGSLDIDNVLINGTTIGHTDDTDLITLADGVVTVAGEVSMTTLDIGGTNVTSTATELNLLDGVTSTTAELNILDGVTSTAAELNILDGVTSTAAELNILDGVTSTFTELNLLDGVTSTTAELNILDGVTSTAAELNLVDGLVGIVAKTSATGSALLPTGNTAQRDGSPTTGAFRFNSTLTAFEGYNGSAWGSVGGGATGGVGNEMFYENDQIADASYTIPANRNALTTGPITIADGVTITVSDGSRLVVI